jgi:alpha-L-fucosidase
MAMTLAAQAQETPAPKDPVREKRLEWWREARFGMMIHWGLYAIPAGEWNGKPVAGIGEWIMNRAKIPVATYEQLAGQFNPVKFNADEWVAVAKSAGAKYIVITSKHHDGFAMYGSKASKYNIVDATPFHRDPLKELAAACQRGGIKLCFYYSQTQDWHEPDGNGNTWDWPDESKKNFTKYLNEKVKPQVTELLTGYGPIGLIWFDTPRIITKEQSQELYDLVHKLQPDCLVSGRIGHGLGDYDSAGDNQIAVGKVQRDWETPVTMNDTWGFKKDDSNWKPVPVLIRQLVQIASRGGNYLLNVGPTAEGVIPQPSVERMAAIGTWLRANSEAVNGTGPSPFPYNQDWGMITTKPGKMYLHVFNWPGETMTLLGVRSKVTGAKLLAGGKALPVSQAMSGGYALTIHLPGSAPDPYDTVIALDVPQKLDVITTILQQPDGAVHLNAYLAEIHKAANSRISLDNRGVFQNWTNAGDWLSWEFQVLKPGRYRVTAVSSTMKDRTEWDAGSKVKVELSGKTLEATMNEDAKAPNPASPYWTYIDSNLGEIEIAKAGTYTLNLRPETIAAARRMGLTLVEVRLK